MMEKQWNLCVFLILVECASIMESTVTCNILDQFSSCRYTVSCEYNAGSAPNLSCDYENSVTFQMKNSYMETISAGFFGATNFDSRVRFFEAINNDWKIIAPSAFRYYSKTHHMNLANNRISVIQNEAFKNLIYLTYLNLSSNSIEELYSSSLVLSSDKKDTDVEILDLSNNIIRQISHNTLSEYGNLKELYLQNNKIANLEDDVFSNLKNLNRLYLQGNKIASINMTLINLKALKELDLSHNEITKLSGYETNRLTSIENVNMSFNNIEFIESNCFNQAFHLQILDLSNNNIKSIIDNVIFINNGMLRYLNLYNNNITKIAENAFQHNILSYLNLENNFISGDILEGTFAGLQRIERLNFYKQNLTSIKSNGLKDMIGLESLNCSTNHINKIDQSCFKNTSSLKILDLSHNNISSLNFFKDVLFNVTEVYLNNNLIVSIPMYTFANQTLIKILDISMNMIVTLEQFSLPLNNLQYLNVSGNFISGSLKSNVTSPAKYLRNLDLSGFNITKIENMTFTDMPVLARLNLSNNAIEYIGPNNFQNLDNMFSLDLSRNNFLSLQLNSSTIKNLNALYLNNNKLRNISDALPNSSQILYLDVSQNNISKFSGADYSKLKTLRVLLATNNQIKTFTDPLIKLLSELNTLSLSSNQLSAINVSYFTNLVSLDVSNNIISNINNTFLQNMDYLQVLDISNNSIKALPPGAFQNLKMLKLLNVSSNSIAELRYGTLRGLNRAEVIDLSRNNIAKMDVEVFHECPELTKLIIDYNFITELEVQHLIAVVPKLTSLSIGGNPLSCRYIVHNIKNINGTAFRSVEVTSIHKVFHEDNVNGIKCGDDNFTTPLLTPVSSETPPADTSSSLTLTIWCSVLTVIIVILAVAFLLYKRKLISNYMYSQTRLDLRRSVELSGSDFQSDLLS